MNLGLQEIFKFELQMQSRQALETSLKRLLPSHRSFCPTGSYCISSQNNHSSLNHPDSIKLIQHIFYIRVEW